MTQQQPLKRFFSHAAYHRSGRREGAKRRGGSGRRRVGRSKEAVGQVLWLWHRPHSDEVLDLVRRRSSGGGLRNACKQPHHALSELMGEGEGGAP